MLSRRFLRIKVMQAIYAFQQEGPESISAGEKQLIVSLDKLYELYIYQLSLIIELSDFARRRIEENRLKQLPTQEDIDPNLRFIQNRFIAQLQNNRDYLKRNAAYKINWVDEEEMIRKLYNLMREDEGYISYMNKDSVSYSDEKQVVVMVVLRLFSESDHLRSLFDEKSIYWTEDFDTAIMMVDKTIKGYKETADEFTSLPTLLKDENHSDGSEDMHFVKHLYRKTLINSNELNGVIKERASNWDLERIAVMDTILIKMAITELIEFQSIPIKVTLNEYIELSKEYSSPKSKIFINGLLDKLITEYKEKGIISKSGRGLIE
ncbi:MAG: transcription antitermination factor NusB [Bacteroidales bacterium]